MKRYIVMIKDRNSIDFLQKDRTLKEDRAYVWDNEDDAQDAVEKAEDEGVIIGSMDAQVMELS